MAVKNFLASLSLLAGLAGAVCWSSYAIAVDDAESSENIEALDPSTIEELSDENIDSLLPDPIETNPIDDASKLIEPSVQTIDDVQPVQDEKPDIESELTDDSHDPLQDESEKIPASTSTDTSTTTVVEKVSKTTKIPLSATIPSQSIGPSRGSTMNDVRAEVGEPSEILSPVGDPPISRWVYSDYTVVFEHDRVIHVVAKRS